MCDQFLIQELELIKIDKEEIQLMKDKNQSAQNEVEGLRKEINRCRVMEQERAKQIKKTAMLIDNIYKKNKHVTFKQDDE